jgi:hypothetical protein
MVGKQGIGRIVGWETALFAINFLDHITLLSPNITVNTFFVNGFGCLKFMRFEREETLST